MVQFKFKNDMGIKEVLFCLQLITQKWLDQAVDYVPECGSQHSTAL